MLMFIGGDDPSGSKPDSSCRIYRLIDPTLPWKSLKPSQHLSFSALAKLVCRRDERLHIGNNISPISA